MKTRYGGDRDLALLMVTGHAGIDEAIKALKVGVLDFMAKPLHPDHLVHAVKRAEEHINFLVLERAFKEKCVLMVKEKTDEIAEKNTELMLANESPEPMNPCLAVGGALDLMGEQLRLANINVISEFPDYELQVMGHPILLEQVVLNLLANARDQVRNNSIDNKEIRLSVRENGDSAVEIEISDSCGDVPEAVIGRIFEPFYTTKKSVKAPSLVCH